MSNYSRIIVNNILNFKFDNRKLINKAIDSDPTKDLVSLSNFLFEKGFVDDSIYILKILNKKLPNNDEIKLALAENYIENSQDDEALNLISEIPKNSSFFISAQLDKADLYQNEGLLGSAEGVLLDLQNLSSDPVVRFALAEFYNSEGENQKAIQLYKLLIRSGINNIGRINLHKRLAFGFAYSGEFENAILEFKQVGIKNLSSKELSVLAHAYEETKHVESAIDIYEKNIANFGPKIEDCLQLADLYDQVGKKFQEEKILKESTKINPFSLKASFKLALFYSNNKNYKNSNNLLNDILKKDENDLKTLTLLANNYLHQKKYQKVIDLLSPYVNKDTFYPHFLWYLAKAYYRLNNIGLAKNKIINIGDYFNEDADFLKDAFFILRNVNRNKAQKYLKKYLKLIPDDIEMENYLFS